MFPEQRRRAQGEVPAVKNKTKNRAADQALEKQHLPGAGRKSSQSRCRESGLMGRPHSSLKNKGYGDFPAGPVAKAQHSQCRGPRFDPWSGLPRRLNGEESTCRCRRRRRHGFDPWVRKSP